MASDPTPVMSEEDRRRSAQLSLQSRRPPTTAPGYDLERFLGEGAFGEVWVATDRNTGFRVAIKFYTHRVGGDWSLLSREVEKLRSLKADHYFVQLLEVGWNATPPYYIMDFMERGSLEEALAKGLPPVDQAVNFGRETATALIHAHAKGILHCDLKPANILLDPDGKPRLADFGQARLTHEQNPALGTLFYMAPEQADLKAAPDARWDVYALGAILYCLLVGEPPHRTEATAAAIQEGQDLAERLRRYREVIDKSPRPTLHRKVPGVDARLADIIDRCLAPKQQMRFRNAQAVVDALDNRAVQRARRPLFLLGIVGPVLLLLVIGFFAWSFFETAVGAAEDSLSASALVSNRYAACFAAESVERQITQRWDILDKAAQDKELADRLNQAAGKEPDGPEQARLQEWLDAQQKQYEKTTAARRWFLVDGQGFLLAASPADERTRQSIKAHRNIGYRSFFHGAERDLTDAEAAKARPKPIRKATKSIVFENTTDKTRIVVFSVPVMDRGGEPRAVLGMGVNLGAFTDLQAGEETGQHEDTVGARWAVLVETRTDWQFKEGLILQHPWMDLSGASPDQLPKVYLPPEVVEQLQRLRRAEAGQEPLDQSMAQLPKYNDPMGDATAGLPKPWSQDYKGPWLAAAASVIVDPRKDGEDPVDTGWVVVVEERTRDALDPVGQLKQKLLLEGAVTLGVVFALMGGLWGFVYLLLNNSARSRLTAFLRRRAGLRTITSSIGVTGTPGSSSAVEGPSPRPAPTMLDANLGPSVGTSDKGEPGTVR